MIPILHGPRVTLRGFSWADFAEFAAMWLEPEVAEYIPFAPVPASQSWSRFNGNISRWVRAGHGNWAVTDLQGTFIGTTGFFVRDGQGGDAVLESGWVFRAAAHGRGLATEAVLLTHEWLDQQPFGGRSMCMMDADHQSSIRVAEKAGYQSPKITKDQWGKVQTMERRRAD